MALQRRPDSGFWERFLFILFVAASIIPIWLPHYLPLVDIPQHAAQVSSFRELIAGNPFFAENLTVNWFTPYLTGYLLLYVLSSILPIVIALKVLVSLAVAGVPMATGLLLRSLGADVRLRWLAIPASYSFAVYWGFLSFIVAVPLAILLIALTVRFERSPSLRFGLAVSAFAAFLFFSHVVAFGFASAVSVAYLLAKNIRRPRRFLVLTTPVLPVLPVILVWLVHLLQSESAVRASGIEWGSLAERMTVLFAQVAGMDGEGYLLSVLLLGCVALLPYLSGCRISRRPERWVPLLVGLSIFVAFPSVALNTYFLHHRLAVFLVPLWLVIWDPPRKAKVFPLVIASFAIGSWIAFNVSRFNEFSRLSNSFENVMESAEPGKRMAGLLVCNSVTVFANPVFLHFVAWYQAEKNGLADMSFATTHPSLVRYRDMDKARVRDHALWYPLELDWVADGGETYDYYLVCAPDDLLKQIFGDHFDALNVKAVDRPWWLFARKDRNSGDSQ